MPKKKAARKKKYAVPMTVVRLVEKVQKHILEEPKRFDMSLLAKKITDKAPASVKATMPECGTVACIAGWVGIIQLKDKLKWRVSEYDPNLRYPTQDLIKVASKALKLGVEDGYYHKHGKARNGRCVATEMFDDQEWPTTYRTRYDNAMVRYDNAMVRCEPDKAVLARIAVQRLNHYLRTGK